MRGTPYRLPRLVWPVQYDIDLTADPARPDFEGRVTIALRIETTTRTIELHARELLVSEPALMTPGQSRRVRLEELRDLELVRLHCDTPLEPGPAELTLNFRGTLSSGMHGLYLATDGQSRAIASQCEATDARAIFPCFDEPEFKARFAWTIRAPTAEVVLANGPVASVEDDGPTKVWRFAATELVSSYLAALTIGSYESTEESEANGVPVRVWATVGKRNQAYFALQFTKQLIPWYEEYFGVPYPFAKYDQVAVPGFDAGAMENVGLVLFRQNLLLMDPGAASWNQEKLVAKVIAHELAHMWFGNLVTMTWWDDLWLNEAFAEWFAHKATHAVTPSYFVWNDFQSDKNRALVDDALPTTHAIYSVVHTPEEALEMFDVITYQKGCAVMRMLEHFLGEEPFREGIRTYMKAFSHRNARGDDLWNHLGQASKQPVGALMRSWIDQAGFPLVTVDATDSTLRLKQQRFYSRPGAKDPGQTWNVPMVVRFEDDEGLKTHRFIFDRSHGETELPARGEVRWCYPNASEIGFYRVRLEDRMLEGLLDRGRNHLETVEKMGFIEDQWALVRSGLGTVERFVPVLESFAETRDHNVARAVMDRYAALDGLLERAEEREARDELHRRVAELFLPHVRLLGYEPRTDEPQNDIQLRALAIYAVAGLAGHQEAVRTCETWADREHEDPRSVDANLAGTFLTVAARYGDATRYERWVETYQDRKAAGAPPQAVLRYLHTLATFRTEELVKRTLHHLNDGLIPQESLGSVLAQLFQNPDGRQAAWEHLKARWAEIRDCVGDMGLSRVVEAVGRLDGRWRQDVVQFFDGHSPRAAERALARGLESMDQREELSRRILPALVEELTAIPPRG